MKGGRYRIASRRGVKREESVMKRIGLLLSAVVVIGLFSTAAEAQFTNIVVNMTKVVRVSTTTNENANSPEATKVTFNITAPGNGYTVDTTSWLTPDVAPWPVPNVNWLYVVVSVKNTRAVRDLEHCEDLALVAMNRPDKYSLTMNLGMNPGDKGEVVVNSAGVPWAYRVTFDDSVYFTCALYPK
jgi:hypothetical protein